MLLKTYKKYIFGGRDMDETSFSDETIFSTVQKIVHI